MNVRPDSRTAGPTAAEVVAADRLLAIAHRGASHVAPENTLPAFQAALELNVDLVEFDYHESSDHVPVVFHDDQLDRTTDACRLWQQTKIPLVARSLAGLRELDAGRWFSERFAGARIPTLAESLNLITPKSIALVERKAGSAEPLRRTAARIRRDRPRRHSGIRCEVLGRVSAACARGGAGGAWRT